MQSLPSGRAVAILLRASAMMLGGVAAPGYGQTCELGAGSALFAPATGQEGDTLNYSFTLTIPNLPSTCAVMVTDVDFFTPDIFGAGGDDPCDSEGMELSHSNQILNPGQFLRYSAFDTALPNCAAASDVDCEIVVPRLAYIVNPADVVGGVLPVSGCWTGLALPELTYEFAVSQEASTFFISAGECEKDPELLFQHCGAADPTTEGWTLEMFGGGVEVGPVLDDGGVDSWSIANPNNGYGYYRAIMTPEQHELASSEGWVLRARLSVDGDTGEIGATPAFGYRNGQRTWQAHLGRQPDGDPIIELWPDVVIALEGAGGGHHLYTLVLDPGQQSATLWVDGKFVADGYEGHEVTTVPGVLWGSFNNAVGQGSFNLVEFDIPAPPPCLDLTGNGEVGAGDLADLLAAWGPCDSSKGCSADINSDGVVGPADLAGILANWGPCSSP